MSFSSPSGVGVSSGLPPKSNDETLKSSTDQPLATSVDPKTPSVGKGASGAKRPRSAEKPLKDPLAPKRPMSSFMIFANETRPQLASLEGEAKLTIGEIGKELGKRWSEMTGESKATYEEKAREAKTAYEQAMKNYQPSEEFLKEKAAHQELMATKNKKKNHRHFSPQESASYFKFVSNNWLNLAKTKTALTIPVLQNMLWEAWCAKVKPSKKSESDAANQFESYVTEMRGQILQKFPEISENEMQASLIQKWSSMSTYEKSAF